MQIEAKIIRHSKYFWEPLSIFVVAILQRNIFSYKEKIQLSFGRLMTFVKIKKVKLL